MKKKVLSLILAVICVAVSFSACTSPAEVTDSEQENGGYNYVIDSSMFNIIEADGTSKYDIVRKENASEAVLSACMNLRNTIHDTTGVQLEVKSDFEKAGHPEYQRQDFEILVGYTNRDESAHAAETLERARDYVILQEGTRIAILAKSDAYIEEAVNYFIENYVHADTCSVAVTPGLCYVVKYDYPIDTFNINGTDINDYTIEYVSDEYKGYADAIYNYVFQNYGVSIDVEKTAKTTDEHVITFAPDAEKYPEYYENIEELESRITVNEGKIVFSCGMFGDLHVTIQEFIEAYFNTEADIESSDIAYTVESSSVTRNDDVIKIDDAELLADIDKKAEDRRNYIENTPNMFTELPEGSTSRIFYVSNDGSDSNTGRSEDEPWATIDKVNISGFLPGDVVLFKRGDEFRGKIKLSDGVTYSSYGTGAKPVINGSSRNYADPSYWLETDVENVYKCVYMLDNVGNIVFDYSGKIGNFDETIGQLRIHGADGFSGYGDLSRDLEFCSELDSKYLYLYSEKGNPGSRFKSIEICEGGNNFQGSNKNVTVDNLTIIFGGSHGVGSGTVENRTVQNCIFAWIGGSILKGYNGKNLTRYGNAVEVYGGCNGYYVYDNWIYQIYDTGITHQYSNDDKVIKMENIEYRGNLVELCHWSIEYYNRGSMPGSCLYNVHVHDNMTLHGAYGWGSVGREGGAALHNSFQIIDEVDNYVVENNIFAYSKGNIVRYNEGGDRKITFRNNTYVQYYDRALGYMFGKQYKYDGSALTQLVNVMNEEDPVICFIMHDAEKEAEEAARAEAEGSTEA